MVTPQHMTREESKAALLAALDQGPKATAQLYDVTQMRGSSLGNLIRDLLKKGLISRETMSRGRYRYYIGSTAPGWVAETQPRKPVQYAVPVRKVIVRPFSIAGENGTSAEVTLPAAPWEVAA